MVDAAIKMTGSSQQASATLASNERRAGLPCEKPLRTSSFINPHSLSSCIFALHMDAGGCCHQSDRSSWRASATITMPGKALLDHGCATRVVHEHRSKC